MKKRKGYPSISALTPFVSCRFLNIRAFGASFLPPANCGARRMRSRTAIVSQGSTKCLAIFLFLTSHWRAVSWAVNGILMLAAADQARAISVLEGCAQYQPHFCPS